MENRVVVRKGRANPLWHGHPWLFSGGVDRIEGQPLAGDAVAVVDVDGRLIGRGLYSPDSQIVVRMMTLVDEPIDDALLARRLDAAIATRRRLGLPSAATNAYRLVNSEGDGLPGLTIDVFDGTLVVQHTTIGMKRREATLHGLLRERFGSAAGFTLVEVAPSGVSSIERTGAVTRLLEGKGGIVEARENGLVYEVDPLGGQKTGMFLDQRDNRRRIAELASGARVLDVYCYVGGFALNALAAGAKEAVCVDSSARAIERCRAHATRNQLGPVEAVEADAFRYLETVRPRSFDLVVLDPPKFCKSRKDLDAALRGYERLNLLGLNACADGAILATASCSQLVDHEQLERVLTGAARAAGRRVQLLESRFQGPDHPTLPGFVEGRYLKLLICRVE